MVQKTVNLRSVSSCARKATIVVNYDLRDVVESRREAKYRDGDEVSLALNESSREHWVFRHIDLVQDEEDEGNDASNEHAKAVGRVPGIGSTSPVDTDEEEDDSKDRQRASAIVDAHEQFFLGCAKGSWSWWRVIPDLENHE